MATSRVLVTGASGFIGARLIPALLQAGHAVRALTRAPSRYRAPDARVEVAQGDVLDPASLDAALHGCTAAYYLVHAMGLRGDFETRDRRGAENFRDAAARAGLEHVLYLGGLGDREAADLSPHLRSRNEVGDILLAGPVPATVLRAAIIIGAGGASFEMMRQLVMRLPAMVTPRWVNSRCQPIAVEDVLRYLVASLAEPRTRGRVLDIGGPEVLTYREMMATFADLLGKRLPMLDVPVLTPHLSAYWVDLVTDTPAPLAHALIEGLRNDVVCTNDDAQRLMPFPLTPFREAVLHALREEPLKVQRRAGLVGTRPA